MLAIALLLSLRKLLYTAVAMLACYGTAVATAVDTAVATAVATAASSTLSQLQ